MNEQLNLFLPHITVREYRGKVIEEAKDIDLKLPDRDTPKVPIYYHDSKSEYMSFFACPCCNNILAFSATGISNYCNNCGQRLEWDEIIEADLL
jgi:hypothetical protein